MANRQNLIKRITHTGFTVVELVVVIVVIGILAAITVVGYGAWQKTIAETQIKNDINSARVAMENYRSFNGKYPDDFSTIGFKASDGVNIWGSSINNGASYSISATSNRISSGYYTSTNNSEASFIAQESCPSGFIKVPGSITYGTTDFCVMKYEAKNVGGKAVSQAAGLPWVNVYRGDGGGTASSVNAINASAAACAGCHLITEAEWMTIAQNVLKVPSNWNTGLVGSGFIYSGHGGTTLAPDSPLAASTNDNDGYFGETMNPIDIKRRRTLTTNNGEVIWDMAGNVAEWTSGTVSSGKPGVPNENGYNNPYQWNNPAVTIGVLSPDPRPSSTGIAGANTWNYQTGVGMLVGITEDTMTRALVRGGAWSWYNFHAGNGILTLDTNHSSYPFNNIGFRAAKTL